MSPSPRPGERAHRHRLLAYGYAAVVGVAELGPLGRLRAATIAAARGRLLIVGAGQGHDLAHLPPAVNEVVAVEPDPAMRRLGRARLAGAAVTARYVGGLAERLPLPDASVDTALATLVLCSVRDPDAAARELRRVLRPDGVLLVLEHVRAPAGSRLARVQDVLDRPWGLAAGGCHLNRRTRAILEQAGFDTGGLTDQHLARPLPLIDPAVQGVARPRPR